MNKLILGIAGLGILIPILVFLAFWATVIFVAIHFASKYW